MRECEKFQEMISALLDGELSEAEQTELQAHMAECEACSALSRAFAAVSAAVLAEEVPDTLHHHIMAGVNTAASAVKKQNNLIRIRRYLSYAACLVVVVGTVFALQGNLNMKIANTADPAAAEAPRSVAAGGDSLPNGAAKAQMENYSASLAETEVVADAVCDEDSLELSVSDSRPEAPAEAEPQANSGYSAGIRNAWYSSGDNGQMRKIPAPAALGAALAPRDDEAPAEMKAAAFDYVLELELADGSIRSLGLCIVEDTVWVAEAGNCYPASCTPAELEAILN